MPPTTLNSEEPVNWMIFISSEDHLAMRGLIIILLQKIKGISILKAKGKVCGEKFILISTSKYIKHLQRGVLIVRF